MENEFHYRSHFEIVPLGDRIDTARQFIVLMGGDMGHIFPVLALGRILSGEPPENISGQERFYANLGSGSDR